MKALFESAFFAYSVFLHQQHHCTFARAHSNVCLHERVISALDKVHCAAVRVLLIHIVKKQRCERVQNLEDAL